MTSQPAVCSFESRRSSEMQSLITRHGGIATVVASMQEIPIEQNREVIDFAKLLVEGKIDVTVFLTGVGAAALLNAMQPACSRERIVEAFAASVVVVRGPKPVPVLRDAGIRIDYRAAEPNTWREVMQVFAGASICLNGKRIAVQEYGELSLDFHAALQQQGAIVLPIPVYRWALPDDLVPLRRVIEALIRGAFDIVLLTSANQLRNVMTVAARDGVANQVVAALAVCHVGSIGPTCSESLAIAGIRVDFEASPPRMGQLVRGAIESFRQSPQNSATN